MSSILVVGAGELGTTVLRALALSPKRPQATQVTVLLRPESLASPTPAKKQLRVGPQLPRELGFEVLLDQVSKPAVCDGIPTQVDHVVRTLLRRRIHHLGDHLADVLG